MNKSLNHRWMYAAVAILFFAALIPWPTGPIAQWLHGVVTSLLVPVSEPMTRIVASLRPPRGPQTDVSDPRVREYEEQLQQARERQATLEATVAYLARMLDEFQKGYASDILGQYRLVAARRAGVAGASGHGTFTINVGRDSGAVPGTIVIAGGYQLVGRISLVNGLTAEVLPMTQRLSPRDQADLTDRGLSAQVLRVEFFPPDPAQALPGILGTLEPVGDGTLAGRIDAAAPVEVGDLARLNDEAWGDSLSRLLVGKVIEVRPSPQQPLYREVIVAPSMDVANVYDVRLRVHRTDSSSQSGGDD